MIYVHREDSIIISMSRVNHTLSNRFNKNIWKHFLKYVTFYDIGKIYRGANYNKQM